MRREPRWTARCVLLLALLWPPLAAAQLQLSAVRGTVRTGPDPAAGAEVVLVDALGAAVASTTAAADGTFALSTVSAGRYALRAQSGALRSATQWVEVHAGRPVEVSLQLVPLSSEAIEVTS